MRAPQITLSRLLRDFFAILDPVLPGWRTVYDAEGLEQALIDLAGDDTVRIVNEEWIDNFDECWCQLPAILTESVQKALASSEFSPVMVESDRLFRLEARSLLEPDALKRARKECLKIFLAFFEPHVEKRIRCIRHAREERNRRYMKRRPLLGNRDPGPDPRLVDPAAAIEARELASRVIRRLRYKIGEARLDILRAYLFSRDLVTESAAAVRAGISNATMTRILRTLRRIVMEELSATAQEVTGPFLSELSVQLIAA